MNGVDEWSDDEITFALGLSDQQLGIRLMKNSGEQFYIEEGQDATKTFLEKNFIKIRSAICGKLDYTKNRDSIRARIDYIKDIATLITAFFPPAILLYAAVAIFNFGVENVCKE